MPGHEMDDPPLATQNDPWEIRGWMMYDWANSAFVTTVGSALLGPYILSLVAATAVPLTVFGQVIQAGAIFPFAVSLSKFIQVLLLPWLGAIADYTHLKKKMLLAFAYAGAGLTLLLFLIRADMPWFGTRGAILLASVIGIAANICFGAAVVFYNAFLPEIASPDRRDEVSARGFAVGYLGGGLLLLGNLGLIYWMADKALATRISLASAGVWWLVFTYLFPHRRLRQRQPVRTLPPGSNLLKAGGQQVRHVLRAMWHQYPMTLRYLVAYLVYNDGIQTVLVVATTFAAAEVGADAVTIVSLGLIVQFVAFVSAFGFGYIARRIGAKRAIFLSLLGWCGVVIYAAFFLTQESQLLGLGVSAALVLGGSQALSRSLFSQMIPAQQEASFFGFYEISERGTSWLGPLAFALVVQITGSQRPAMGGLLLFFGVGLLLLSRVNVRQAMQDAGHDPAGVVI